MALRTRPTRPAVVIALLVALAVTTPIGATLASAAGEPKRPPQVSDECVTADLAAGGYCGDGGQAARAGLSAPRDVSFFPSGDLLIADGQNGAIRLVDHSSGKISTVAGLGISGDAAPTKPTPVGEVALADPRGVAALPDGSFAIADAGLHAVLLVKDGLVTTLLHRPQIKQPADVAALDADSLVVTDTAAGKVIRLDLDGRRHTVANGLERPWQVAVEPAGSFLVSQVRPTKRSRAKRGRRRTISMRGNVVRVPARGGKRTVVAGPGAAGEPGALRFARVSGVAVRADGSILVADTKKRATGVQAISPLGTTTYVVGGSTFASQMRLGQPEGIAYFGGVLAVADAGTNQVYQVPLDPAGPVTAIGIDYLDPGARAIGFGPATSSSHQVLEIAKTKHRGKRRRRRIDQTLGTTPCVSKRGMPKTWTAAGLRKGKIQVPFGGKGIVQVKLAPRRTGGDFELSHQNVPRPDNSRTLEFATTGVPHRNWYVRVIWHRICHQTPRPFGL